ncbi:MAG TPA: phosphatidylglycerophosphatase A [Pyrinomonadaceae bacterium]|jgi:phosphatidylglycerophosphatase A|nr:phosphatidylglycerophosphatase A [Pyrinomonadaceae bacterium]
MKQTIERRKPEGLLDYISLAVTTFGVGYLPLAPGTWGSMVGVVIYLGVGWIDGIWDRHWSVIHRFDAAQASAISWAVFGILLILFCLVGIWAAGRSTELFGNTDPSQAVVDEVIGQFIVFLFVPFGIGWPLVLAGFLLFRLFDIWKPYPIDSLQNLPAGIGICADDILAGVYSGVCLAIIYAVSIAI